jgi:8-oxo-dGTP pyrophosphatase MutT (NUDIX family)
LIEGENATKPAIFASLSGNSPMDMRHCVRAESSAPNRTNDQEQYVNMDGMKTGSFSDTEKGPRSQYGAACWRMHLGRVEVLLITSRDTGRWVIPKGWPVDGLDPANSAAREAWEEAGVTGVLSAEILGYYSYDKGIRPNVSLPCVVAVFPLHVTSLADRFPERKQRRRKWFAASKAAKLVDEPELRRLLSDLAQSPDRLIATLPDMTDDVGEKG